MTDDVRTLLNSFRAEAVAHSHATKEGDYRAANRAADRVHGLFKRITAGGPEGRQALLELAERAEPEVAIMAATYSLKFDPARSLRVLSKLKSDRGIIGFQAKQAIARWQHGEWKLE